MKYVKGKEKDLSKFPARYADYPGGAEYFDVLKTLVEGACMIKDR